MAAVDQSWSPLCGLGNCLAVCPDSKRRTASVLLDMPHVQLIDLCGNVLRTLSTAEHRPCAQAWSADGGTLFVASRQPSHAADGTRRPAIVCALDANNAYFQVAACALSFTPLALSATRTDHSGACTVAIGGAPGLLVCSFARGELVPRWSFRTPGGPLCCVSFDPSGRWLACINMNGMLALARTSTLLRAAAADDDAPDAAPATPAGSWAAEVPSEPSASTRLATAELHLQFARRLPAAFGTMCEGARPTGAVWAARGLRLLVCSWDGCVELLEAEVMESGRTGARCASEPGVTSAADALGALGLRGLKTGSGGGDDARGGARDDSGDDDDGDDAWEPRWQLRGVRPSGGPIDPSACAPQLCWAASGLAACVTRSVTACQRTVTEAGWGSVAVAEVVLLPLPGWRALAPRRPRALAAGGGEPTVLARYWLREAVAGVGCGDRSARGARADDGAGGAGGAVLLLSTSGRRLNKPLPLEAVLTPADVEAQPLANSGGESVCLRAPCAESSRAHWSLRVVRAEASVVAQACGYGAAVKLDSPRARSQAAESGGASSSGAEIQTAPPAEFQIELPLAQLDWLDAVRMAARAAGAPTPLLAPSRADSAPVADETTTAAGAAALASAASLCVSLSPTLLVVLRANCMYWHARQQRLLIPRDCEHRRTTDAGAWRALVLSRRQLACCALSGRAPRAALLDERGVLGIWCLESNVCVAQVASWALAPARLPTVFGLLADGGDDDGDGDGDGADADAGAGEELDERADGAPRVATLRRDLRLVVLVGAGGGDDGDGGSGSGASAAGSAAAVAFDSVRQPCSGVDGVGYATLRALWLEVRAYSGGVATPLAEICHASTAASRPSPWREVRAEPPCAPGSILGLRAGSALAYWATAADGSARHELHHVDLGGAF